jgi:predicted acyltransferase
MTVTLPPAPDATLAGARSPQDASPKAPPLLPPDSSKSSQPVGRGAKERLLSLDVFRGLTVAGMLLVNNPGSWDAIYPPLEHAAWNGWTPTDLIFPFFLFIVGITTHLSLEARRARGDDDGALVRQIVKRGAFIVLLGLLMSAFPYYPLDRITTMRFPGVLQRIGVAYTCGALLTLRMSLKAQCLILVAILFGYWITMTLVPVPGRGMGALLLDDPPSSLAAYIDRTVFGVHLWKNSKTWDPEGLLTTVPAIGSVILGVFAGRWIGTQRPLESRLVALFGVGSLCMMAGLMWGWSFPINKSLWTSSYVLFTGGMGAVALATCIWLIDVLGVRWWTKPFLWYGMNPMVAFVGSGIMARTIYSLITVPRNGERVSIQRVIYENFYATWLEPRNASLLFAITFVLVWAGVLGALYRKRIFFKV